MKVLVVITDKKSDSSQEEVQIASEKLKDDGVRVIAVALGDESDTVTPEVIKPGKDSRPKDVVEQLVKTVLNGLFQLLAYFNSVVYTLSLDTLRSRFPANRKPQNVT